MTLHSTFHPHENARGLELLLTETYKHQPCSMKVQMSVPQQIGGESGDASSDSRIQAELR